MEGKDVDTNQSLNSENTIQQNLISYGQEMNEGEVIAIALSKLDHEGENFEENALCYRQQLQQTLEKIDKSKRYVYESHCAGEKFRECAENYTLQKDNEEFQKSAQRSLVFHQQFIEGAQDKVQALIQKIKEWRNKRILIEKIQARTLRINGLIKKKYNMKNYIEQMQLVQGLITRVGNRLNLGDFDYRFLQQLMSKQLIPYNFYHNYCYNIIFHIITTKIKDNSLIVFKKSEHLPELFNHMKNFFNRNIYQNCQQFIKFMKHVRIINEQNLCIQDGFAHLFKPFFLRILQEIDEIQSTSFLKARSLMQFNEFTIQTWKEFEELLLQKYILWNYEQHNYLRKMDLIRVAQLKASIRYFKQNYQWINHIGLKSNKIHGNNDFPTQFLKATLLKIFKPILSQLYIDSYPSERLKSYQKYKKQFQDYWFYCIFGKNRAIYKLIGHQLRNIFNVKIFSNVTNIFEQGELNIDQYYQYYQQLEEALSQQLSKEIGRDFKEMWHECWLRVSKINKKQCETGNLLDEQLYQFSHIRQLQSKLQHCISNKKAYKKDERIDIIYGLLMNLNFNSSRYFLLRDGLKCLDKSAQKQINSIRDVAYHQLYE